MAIPKEVEDDRVVSPLWEEEEARADSCQVVEDL